MSSDFTPEQKRYLEGFVSGIQARGSTALQGSGAPPAGPEPRPMGPDAPHLIAQDETVRAGKKLADQEKWKREEHPFDAYHKLNGQAARGEYPKAADNFRWRYYGLFYVAPAQNSYMCRLRIANGILSHWQFAGVADLAEKFGGGYAHATTRANLQFREIAAKDAIHVVEGIQDLGLTSRGSGADNIRNVTGDATAGIGPRELIDTRPHAREWHFHILNQRALYGLPRKFNVAFDGGGAIPTLEDTNDIGFQAVEVEDGAGVEPGVWFKLILGGITGHKDLARETGAIVRPGETTEIASAIVRVFIAEGDRTNRNKARLKYVLDRYAAEAGGLNGFLAKVEQQLGRPITRTGKKFIRPRPAQDRQAHIGVHPQKQPGLFYLGAVLSTGRMSCTQMRALAAIAHEFGDGDIRLTVWQNLLISGIPETRLDGAKAAVEQAGLDLARIVDTRRPRRLHRLARLQVFGRRHQGPRRGHRAVVRAARHTRSACQYPSHRLSPLLRPALHRRHRAHRGAGWRQRRGRYGGWLSHRRRRRIWRGWSDRPRDYARREGTGRASEGSKACSRPISPIAPAPAESFQAFSARHEVGALQTFAEGQDA